MLASQPLEENVAPELRLIRRGRKRLVPVTELERWVAQAASGPTLEEVGGTGRRRGPTASANRTTLGSNSN